MIIFGLKRTLPLRVIHIPNRLYVSCTLLLLMLGCVFLLNGGASIHQYALNTKNHYTHRITINFPERNIETFADMPAYTDMIIMGLQKIPGITEIHMQQVSAPFTDQYVYQMIIDAAINVDTEKLTPLLDQFCRNNNLIFHDCGECPDFANKINLFMILFGLAIIFVVLYFFAVLIKMALAHEKQKIRTLQLMGAPRSMISLLFHQEIKNLIVKVVGWSILAVMAFYLIRYCQTTAKASFFSQYPLYLNTFAIPLSAAFSTILLAKCILITQMPKESSAIPAENI